MRKIGLHVLEAIRGHETPLGHQVDGAVRGGDRLCSELHIVEGGAQVVDIVHHVVGRSIVSVVGYVLWLTSRHVWWLGLNRRLTGHRVIHHTWHLTGLSTGHGWWWWYLSVHPRLWEEYHNICEGIYMTS